MQKNKETIANTYEWCADGVQAMISKLQNVPANEIDGWLKEFKRHGAFAMDILDESAYDTPEGKALLEMQGIQGLIAVPLMNGNEIIGLLGVDNPSKAKQNVNVLKNVATVAYSEILRRKSNDEEHVTLLKLADTFLSVYFVDLSSDYMHTWKIADEYKDTYGSVLHYSESMGHYVRDDIAERDRERCIEMTSPAYVLSQFQNNDRFSIEMTDILLGYERNIVFDYVKVSEDGRQFVICARDVTDSLAREKAQQKKLQDALDREVARAQEEKVYQMAILSNAYSYFRINLSQNRIIPPIIEKIDGKPVDYTDKFPRPMPSYEEIIAIGAKNYVDDQYKESYRSNHNCAYLLKCFNEGNMMPEYVCRIYSTTIGWHYRKYITYLSKDENTGEIYGMTVAYDITKEFEAAEKEKRYKAELEDAYNKEREQQQQLKTARVAAEAANTAKTNFLFSMSHDIRTPMNAITGFTNMAIKHIDNKEKTLDCLDKIQKSGNMLLSLINSVLEVSRIEAGEATLDEQHGDILLSFTNIEHTLQELAKTKDINLSFEFGEIRNRFVYADFSRCMRIFVNVISNAIKYTNEGGFVKVRCEQIGEEKDGYATYKYTIADNGIGMSEEFQKHVFEQFARENTATVSGIQGTGLGMSVVKSFVELMGGTIGVKSKQGEGSIFTIILPFKLQKGETFTDPETGELVTTAEVSQATYAVDFNGKKVLLVEDNELNREIASEILGEAGLVIDEAEDGSQAVELLQDKGPHYYDFILMDVQMPIMNGYEATKAIRAMYPDAKIPIIALSANAFAEDKAASLAAGMDAHVAKPIKQKELFATLAKFVGINRK